MNQVQTDEPTEETEVASPQVGLPLPEAFSFAAAGWLKMYYFGVGAALLKARLHEQACFAGASAGSLVAAATILELDFDEIRNYSLSCVEKCHGSYSQAFRCREFLCDIMESTLNREKNVIERLSNRLNVSVTTLPWIKSKNYSQFESVEQLKQVMIASCCAPPIAGFPFKLDGEWVIDGGLSSFQPLVPDKKNVTVSIFYFSKADIKPSRYLPVWWGVYPPRVEDFAWVYDLGFNDAVDWIDRTYPHLLKAQPVDSALLNAHAQRMHTHAMEEHESPGSSVVHAISDCIQRRELSWPYHHSGEEESFARFFGYRSILKIIPSTALDLVVLAFVYFFIKPAVWFLVYSELVVHGILHTLRATWSSIPLIGCKVTYEKSRSSAQACFSVLCSTQLFMLSFPLLTRFASSSSLDPFLAETSAIFRFTRHLF